MKATRLDDRTRSAAIDCRTSVVLPATCRSALSNSSALTASVTMLRSAAIAASVMAAVSAAPALGGEIDWGSAETEQDDSGIDGDRSPGRTNTERLTEDVIPESDTESDEEAGPYDQNRVDERSREGEPIQERTEDRGRERIKEEVTDIYLNGGGDTSRTAEDAASEGEKAASEDDGEKGGDREFALTAPKPPVKPDVSDGLDVEDRAGLGEPGAGWNGIAGLSPELDAAEVAGRITDQIVGAGLEEGSVRVGALDRYMGMPGVSGQGEGRIGAGYGGIFGEPSGVEGPGWVNLLGRRACCGMDVEGHQAKYSPSPSETEELTPENPPGDQWGLDTASELAVVGTALGVVAAVKSGGTAGILSSAIAWGLSAKKEAEENQSQQEGQEKGTAQGGSEKPKEKKSEEQKQKEKEKKKEKEEKEQEKEQEKDQEQEKEEEKEDDSTLPAPDQRGPGTPLTEDEKELLARFDDTQEEIRRAAEHSDTTMPAEPGEDAPGELKLPEFGWFPHKTTMPVRPGPRHLGFWMLPSSFWNPGYIDPAREN